MTVISTRVKKWGNSLGLIIPSGTVTSRKFKENQKINIIILEDSKKILEETFGSLKNKLKRPAQEIKDELRRDLY